jgi:hypothetical protein
LSTGSYWDSTKPSFYFPYEKESDSGQNPRSATLVFESLCLAKPLKKLLCLNDFDFLIVVSLRLL